MKNYNDEIEWTKKFVNEKTISFPAEYVIRIFKGEYPNLDFNKKEFRNKKICDIGCGDGRNIVLLDQCGFETYGTEITKEIVEKTKVNLKKLDIDSDIRIGTNEKIPFEENFFDYVLSWNSCYYMGKNNSFENHVKEFNRILKPGGYLILSIPKKTSFLFSESEEISRGYQKIKNDPFKVRNGAILRMFKDENEIKENFSEFFTDFVFGSIEDDCFGLKYDWHLVVCKKS